MNIKKIRIRVLFVLFIFSIINFIIFYNTLDKLDQIKNDITKIQTLEKLHFGKQKLNTIRDSLKATYHLDRFKNILFKKDEIQLEDLIILRGFLNDLFNYYIINFQQQGSIYWFLKELESPNGLKFAENVYFKFDINNSKEFQSLLIELNDAAKNMFDQIYEFPDEIFEVISNKKRFYYSKKNDGEIYWENQIQNYKNKSEDNFIKKFNINSFTILEPFVEALVVTTRTLTNLTDSIEKEVLNEKNKTIERYESEKRHYFINLGILIFLQLLIVLILFQKDFKVTFLDRNLIKKNKKRNISIFFGSFLFFLSAIPLVYYLYYLELKQMELLSDIKILDQNIEIYSDNQDLLYDYYDIISQTDLLHTEYALETDQFTKSSKELFYNTSNINKNFPKLLYIIWDIAKKNNKMSEILYVDEIVKDSPSYNLIYKYDKILTVNGKTVSYDNFNEFVNQSEEGEILKLEVLRKNEIVNVTISPKIVQFKNSITNKIEKKKIIGIYFKNNYALLNNFFILQDNIAYREIPNLYEVIARSADPRIDIADYLNQLNVEIFRVATSTNVSVNDLEDEKAKIISLQNQIGRQASLILIVISILDILGTFLLYLFIRIEGGFKKLDI